uniref:Uncharacterized protein n=1 Tax=Tetraselmis sp. GSL018 TaxID=582737 RepID=A0A061SJA3_9CHLO|eukprot:CAMPEP_0177586086 /NCGR_PEP_ID=MMETSP0419_2-20121207/4873_1 /TAXON_ID=582737 /ORGANISM="Tetraselmis sp., Strain GSL018" /LENGTH=185 /DNA_ID=CAMNT_0019075931 /DNA_START=586 /DNA_END=1143 /DNA_ORIENTATION=-
MRGASYVFVEPFEVSKQEVSEVLDPLLGVPKSENSSAWGGSSDMKQQKDALYHTLQQLVNDPQQQQAVLRHPAMQEFLQNFKQLSASQRNMFPFATAASGSTVTIEEIPEDDGKGLLGAIGAALRAVGERMAGSFGSVAGFFRGVADKLNRRGSGRREWDEHVGTAIYALLCLVFISVLARRVPI